jgi:hypothetical protein
MELPERNGNHHMRDPKRNNWAKGIDDAFVRGQGGYDRDEVMGVGPEIEHWSPAFDSSGDFRLRTQG